MSKFKSKTNRIHAPSKYFYQSEIEEDDFINGLYNQTLYDRALRYEESRIFEMGLNNNNDKLDCLAKEIKIQIKISQQAIFIIGEILVEAKALCQESNVSFQDWIAENLNFSYETANNYMNVYKNCFAFRKLVQKIPLSILYNISAPSFPSELREYLMSSGVLDKFTGKSFKDILLKYKEGGIDAVENEIYELGRGWEVVRQISYNFDLMENALRTIEDLKNKFETRGGSKMNAVIEYERQLLAQEPEAMLINQRLHNSILYAETLIEDALNTSRDELHVYKNLLFSGDVNFTEL